MTEAVDPEPQYVLELYIAGSTMHSTRAARSMREICALYLGRLCRLEIIDIYRETERAREAQVIAVPTLVRRRPAPARKLVGDLSDRERVLRFLNLQPVSGGSVPSRSAPDTSDPPVSSPQGQ